MSRVFVHMGTAGSVAHDGGEVSALGGPCRFNLDFPYS